MGTITDGASKPKTPEREPKVTYIRRADGFPAACLVYSRIKKDKLKFGVSVYNPNDKFNRKVALAIAKGRFDQTPSIFTFDCDEANITEILHDLMLIFADKQAMMFVELEGPLEIPARLSKVAQNYLAHQVQLGRITAASPMDN